MRIIMVVIIGSENVQNHHIAEAISGTNSA